MSANPHNVLSAVASVRPVPGLVYVQVLVQTPAGEDAGATPIYPVRSSDPVTVPVLGLRADSSYQLTAQGWLVNQKGVHSEPIDFATGSLPGSMPRFIVVDGGHPSGAYTLVAVLPEGLSYGKQYVPVVDSRGAVAWYLTLPNGMANVGDVQKQPDGTYTVAANLIGASAPGLGGTPCVFMQYDVLGNLLRQWSSPAAIDGVEVGATDPHELRLLGDGTALLFADVFRQEDLSQMIDGGASDAGVWGNVLEHLAPDGGVLFAWSTFDAIPLGDIDPYIPLGGYYIDATHGNAIDVTDDGNYLVSLRDTSEVLKVNATSGEIEWILGGSRSTFTFVDDPEGGFSLQHGARELPDGHIILFDDGNDHVPQVSRAVEYALDLTADTATLVWEAETNPPVTTLVLGYAQRLDNGNTLVTYGTSKLVQEVGPDAGLLWTLFDDNANNLGVYRAYRIDTLY